MRFIAPCFTASRKGSCSTRAPNRPRFTLASDFKGKHVPLSEANFKAALVASGAIPLVIAGVSDIYGAPKGVYRDGGVTDYHLAQAYGRNDTDVTLLFLHQERIIPGWLDKRLLKRQPPPAALENVLMVYPSDDLISRLPLGKVPERDDFTVFADNPAARIDNWRRAVSICEHLGEVFLEAVESNRIKDIVERL